MNVPTIPGQQVQESVLPSAYAQTPETSAAPYLGAVGEAAAKFGEVAQRNAQLLQVRQDQTAVFDFSADARALADAGESQFNQLDGRAALEAGPRIVSDFKKAAAERASNLSPLQQEAARQHAEDIGYGLQKAIDARSLAIGERMHDASLANVVQTETRSAGTLALTGGVTATKPSMRTATPGSYAFPSGTETVLDESGLSERWNAIKSAIEAGVQAKGGDTLLGTEETKRLALEKARSDFVLTVTEGLIAGNSDRIAKVYWDKHRTEVTEPDHQAKAQEQVDAAVDIGDTARATRSIFAAHAGEGGTWSERQAAMLSDAGKQRDEISGKVSSALRAQVSAAREEETKAAGDEQERLLDAYDKGAPAEGIAKQALHLPVKNRDAIATDIKNKANGVVIAAQNDLYQSWVTKAAGIDPATGRKDPEMREEFLAHNFAPDMPGMQRDDYNALLSLKKQIQSGGNQDTDAIITDESIADTVVRRTSPNLKDEARAERLYEVKRQLGTIWKQERGDGPPLSLEAKAKQADILVAQDVFRSAGVLESAARGLIGPFGLIGLGATGRTLLDAVTSNPEDLSMSDLPDDQRQAAEDALRLAGFPHPNDAQVIRQWQNAALEGLRDGVR